MADFITQAHAAVDQADWSTVVSILQRVVLDSPHLSSRSETSTDWLPLAIKVLEEGDFQTQWEAAKVFPSFGKAAIAPLISLLQDDAAELETRWYAARLLGEMADLDAIQALVEQLQSSDDEDLRDVVAEALANLGAAGIDALTELLQAESTRFLALKALAQIHQPATLAPILSVAADSDPRIRQIALESLSALDDPRLPDVFIQGLKDPAAPVRRAAIAGLGSRAAWVATHDLLPLLVDRLWDLNLGVCREAALTLGKLSNEAAVPWLKRVLVAQNTPSDLQSDVILALSWIGSTTAIKSLQECLPPHHTHLPESTLQEIITLLGRCQEPAHHVGIVQSFVTTLDTVQTSSLRQAIATALGELKHPDGLEPLIQLLADPSSGVRLHAIVALQQVDAVAAYTRLSELRSNPEVSESLRDGVIVALREWNAQLPR